MPDEAVEDYNDNSVLLREEDASAPATPRETIVTDYTSVPQMIATLRNICALPVSRESKVATVAALLPTVFLGSGGDPRAIRPLLDLLPSGNAYRDLMRGMVAAAVAWLRAATIDEVSALDGLLKTNQKPFVLGFQGVNARRWYYDVMETLGGKENRAPPITVEAFKLMAPDRGASPTQDEAKKRALEILHFVRRLNRAPLAKDRRPAVNRPRRDRGRA